MIDGNTFAFAMERWSPAAHAAALAVLTFVQEDAPTVSAALLSAAGRMAATPAFAGCFLGIWIGDALLYLAARFLGRPLLQRRWTQRFISASAVQHAENWFSTRGTWVLFASRLIPGSRLPTYLAAGFLGVPFPYFLLITGVAVAVWTSLIFLLARFLGSQLQAILKPSIGTFVGGVIIILVALRLIIKLASRTDRRRLSAWFVRWTRWEFWPAWLFYAPVGAYCLWLAIRYRGLTLPTAANPGIFSGGIVGESKIATLRELQATSPDFTAPAELIERRETARTRNAERGTRNKWPKSAGRGETPLSDLPSHIPVLRSFSEGGTPLTSLPLPFILKPDVGQRGAGVKLIRRWEQVEQYLQDTGAPLICQQYIPGPHEVGIFYYRFPHEPRGRIFAITEKIFPTVTGDGVRTLEELIWSEPRARLIAAKYLSRLQEKRRHVLPAGETFRLVEAGNHAQGCIFRDGMHLWSHALEQRIDDISRRLQGFYIGRYDIRYSSPADLRAGLNFHIIELNGAASEATSIYDSRNTLARAYRTLFRQWDLVFAIGAANRAGGSSPTALSDLWQGWRRTAALVATYPAAD